MINVYKIWLRKLKFETATLAVTLLAVVWKAANRGAALISLGSDWLDDRDRRF